MAADKFINDVGLLAIKNWIEGKFALDVDLDTLSGKVDDIIAEGGEPNTIESISVNGSTVTPDTNKNVALTVPVSTSDLTNDGDGTSNFATESYVDVNGGKIDVIKVNNTALPITSKAVNIDLTPYAETTDLPTATSDLTNDSDFQTSTQVQGLIDAAVADITEIDFQIVTTLPATGVKGVIYLVGTTSPYKEYIWIEPAGGTAYFEQIGETTVDLTDYWTSASGHSNSLVAMTVAEINAILEPSA